MLAAHRKRLEMSAKPTRVHCDYKMRIVMRDNKAVALSILEFAIFSALHRSRNKTLFSRELADAVYRGVTEPPNTPFVVLTIAKKALNRKLDHLGLRTTVTNRGRNSFYRLVAQC